MPNKRGINLNMISVSRQINSWEDLKKIGCLPSMLHITKSEAIQKENVWLVVEVYNISMKERASQVFERLYSDRIY